MWIERVERIPEVLEHDAQELEAVVCKLGPVSISASIRSRVIVRLRDEAHSYNTSVTNLCTKMVVTESKKTRRYCLTSVTSAEQFLSVRRSWSSLRRCHWIRLCRSWCSVLVVLFKLAVTTRCSCAVAMLNDLIWRCLRFGSLRYATEMLGPSSLSSAGNGLLNGMICGPFWIALPPDFHSHPPGCELRACRDALVSNCQLTELFISQWQEAKAEETQATARGAVGGEEEQMQVLENAVISRDRNLTTTKNPNTHMSFLSARTVADRITATHRCQRTLMVSP